MRAVAVTLLGMLIWAVPVRALAYDFPVQDRFVSTVLGTPEALRYPLPAKYQLQEHRVDVFPDRELPEVFWYQHGLRFGLMPHKGEERPLVFIISGTGASFKSAKTVSMARALHQAGFHVLTLSSPTHFNFLANASSTHLPGYPEDDAVDLYRVMQAALEQAKAKSKIEVSSFYLTGYSLGGFNSAFVARLDEERKVFNFKKVLMINPPVSLYSSVSILDDLLDENVPGGVEGAGAFLNNVVERLSAIHNRTDALQFDGDFMYKVHYELEKERIRRGEPESQEVRSAAALVAISFRISSGSIVFSSDVINHSGYIVSPNVEIGKYDSLTEYARISHRVRFTEYVDDMVIPQLLKEYPSETRDKLLKAASFEGIESYLVGSKKIGVMTNSDEVILAPGELDYMRTIFGDRIKVYPRGGHCGNIDLKENVQFMIDFFAS
jgi:hypothetical protein